MTLAALLALLGPVCRCWPCCCGLVAVARLVAPALVRLTVVGCRRRAPALALIAGVRIVLAVAAVRVGLAAGGLGDLAIDLVGEVLELALGPLEAAVSSPRTLSAARSTPSRNCSMPWPAWRDALAASSATPRSTSCWAALSASGILLLVRLADGVEELLGQERLGLLGVLDGAAHPVEELVEPLLCCFEALADLLALAGVAERVLPGFVRRRRAAR